MSDTEDVPELSAEARAFLSKHQATGEPSAEELERGKQRVVSLARGAPSSRRRPLIPPEVMAAAAVVILLLSAQGLYLVFTKSAIEAKPEPTAVMESGEAEVKAIAAAWAAGDLDAANRLASKHCESAVCRPLVSDVTRAIVLASRVDSLAGSELDELAAFDAKLSGGSTRSVLRERVAKRRLELAGPSREDAVDLEEDAHLTIAVGGTGEVQVDQDVSRLAIGDPEIADVSVTGKQKVQLKGMSVGKTTLLIWCSSGARMSLTIEVQALQDRSQKFLSLHVTHTDEETQVMPLEEPEVAATEVQLAPGGTSDITLKGRIARVAVGDPEIADVNVNGDGKLHLEGKGRGRTTVLVWFSEGGRQSLLVEVKGAALEHARPIPNPDPPPEEKLVQVPVGRDILVRFEGEDIRKVGGGNPDIARVRIVKKELRVEGVRPGKTTVQLTFMSDERRTVNIEVTQTRDERVEEIFTRAFQAKSSNNSMLALKLIHSVLRLEPGHTGALHLLDSYRREATDSYLRGYQLRDTSPEEAIKLFTLVLAMTAANDELHLKAQVRLDELQK